MWNIYLYLYVYNVRVQLYMSSTENTDVKRCGFCHTGGGASRVRGRIIRKSYKAHYFTQ